MMPSSRRSKIHIYIEQPDGLVSIEDTLHWLIRGVRSQKADIEALSAQFSQTRQELAAVQSEVRNLQALSQEPGFDTADLEHRMGELDQRLNKILSLVDQARGGGQSEQGMLHHSYVNEYRSLVEQQVGALTVSVFRGMHGVPPREKAVFVAHVCHALFGSPQVQGHEIMERLPEGTSADIAALVGEICVRAQALRQRAAAQGRPQRWDWDFIPESEINPDAQEAWVGSEGEMVEFVVAPAYVVDSDTRLDKQRVFTVTRSGGRLPQPLALTTSFF